MQQARSRGRFTRRGSSGRTRQKYLWDTVITNPVTLAPSANALSNLMPDDPQLTETQNRDLVVVRIVGNVYLLTVPGAGAQPITWAQGIVPVTGVAFGAGSVPNPSFDQPGWMWLQSGRFKTEGTEPNPGDHEVLVDNRSARKIPKTGNILMHIMRNIGGNTLTFELHLRVLYKLP